MLPQAHPTDNTVSDVPYRAKTEDFCLLLACDELSEYCGIIFDFEKFHATAILFDSREQAKSYGLDYKKSVEFDKKAKIDIIGRLGGIVIEKENGYNGYNNLWELSNRTRIFGSKAIELCKDDELRAIIECSFLRTLFSTDLTESDFKYILSLCSTDISYADFCRSFDDIRRIGDSITVVME